MRFQMLAASRSGMLFDSGHCRFGVEAAIGFPRSEYPSNRRSRWRRAVPAFSTLEDGLLTHAAYAIAGLSPALAVTQLSLDYRSQGEASVSFKLIK